MPYRYKIEHRWDTARDVKRINQVHGSSRSHHQTPTMEGARKKETEDEAGPHHNPWKSAEPSVKTDPSVIITPPSSSALDKNTRQHFLPGVQNHPAGQTAPYSFAVDKGAQSSRRMAVVNALHLPAEAFQDHPKDGPLMVVKKPLSAREENEKKEPPELVRGFDVIRKVNQQYPDHDAQDSPGRPADHRLIPQHALPSEVMSARSSRETLSRLKSLRNAGMTPKIMTRSDEVPWNGKPPSPTFQLKGVGMMADGRPLFWQPVVSRRGYDPFVEPVKEEDDDDEEDQILMSRVPSRIIVNIMLPRSGKSENSGKSRGGRLCGRQWTSVGQQPFWAWLSSARSPPPPPPPTAPTFVENDSCDDDDNEGCDDDEKNQDDNDELDLNPHQDASSQSGGSLPSSAQNPPQGVAHTEKPSSVEACSRDTSQPEKHTPTSKGLSDERAKTKKATIADSPDSRSGVTKRPAGWRKEPSVAGEGRRVDVTSHPPASQTSVPPLDLGPRMLTAESSFTSIQQPGDSSPELLSPCRRATHCEFFGPHLCVDCETARHRRQFAARQDLLYPEINVFTRHMVVSQKFKPSKGGRTLLPKLTDSASSRWPYASNSQLNSVVTDFDLCKRVAERGQRSKVYLS